MSVVFRFMPPSETGSSMMRLPCRASAMRSLTIGFAAGPGQGVVHLLNALGFGNAFGLDGFGQQLLLFIIDIGFDLGLAIDAVGIGHHFIDFTLGFFQLALVFFQGRMLGRPVFLHLLVRHFFVFNGFLVFGVEAVVLGQHLFHHNAHGPEHLLQDLLGLLGLQLALFSHVELFGGQLAEDIPGFAPGDGANDLVPQHAIVFGHILEDKGRFFRVNAIGNDHIQADIVAVDGFKQQVILGAPVAPTWFENHFQVLQFGVKGVPIVDKGQEYIGAARGIGFVLQPLFCSTDVKLFGTYPHFGFSGGVKQATAEAAQPDQGQNHVLSKISLFTSLADIKELEGLVQIQRVDPG